MIATTKPLFLAKATLVVRPTSAFRRATLVVRATEGQAAPEATPTTPPAATPVAAEVSSHSAALPGHVNDFVAATPLRAALPPRFL